jgi:2-haloacid dehalogenase
MSNTHGKPTLVCDVNETLLDIDALVPLFEHLFGRREAMREWFAQLVLYSQALSLAGRYAPCTIGTQPTTHEC